MKRSPVDLAAVRTRYRAAQRAGVDAVDGGPERVAERLRAVFVSWQDVAFLHDEVLHLRRALEAAQRRGRPSPGELAPGSAR